MLNLNFRALLSFASLLLICGCATVKVQPGFVKQEFIFETAPFPSCHASTIVETKSGLIAAWFGGTAERNPDVCIYVSRNENGHWTPPVAVADGVAASRQSAANSEGQNAPLSRDAVTNRLPTWNPVLFQPKRGPLMLFYKVGPSPATWWGMLITSDDDGKTWSQPQRLPDGILGPIKNKPVQLANGDILCPSSVEGDGGWRVHFERIKFSPNSKLQSPKSDAAALSTLDIGLWTLDFEVTPPVNNGKEIGAIQPSLLFVGKEKLAAIGRTRNDKLFWIESHDAGKTWGTMTLLDLPNPNSGTDAVTLRDGRQLLVYNHNTRTGSNNKGRSPLNVAVSRDGKNWAAAMVLEDSPDAPNGFAYPAVIQTRDGFVHITYTWERKRIKHVVIDPKKLKLQSIIGGEWPKN